MMYLATILIGVLLGFYIRQIAAFLGRVVVRMARNLPETSLLAIDAPTPSVLPPWAIAGEYLIRDSGQWRNVTLSAYARYQMGERANVHYLIPATVITSAEHVTPSGGKYRRVRRERTYRACLEVVA